MYKRNVILFQCLLYPCCYVILLQFEPGLGLHQPIKIHSLKEVFFLQEMLQEAWHYRQTNFTAYQPSDIPIEFNTELMSWTGKFFSIWVGPSLLVSHHLYKGTGHKA